MTSADFLEFSHASLHGLLLQISFLLRVSKTSPGKSAIFSSIYLAHLHLPFSSSYRASTWFAALPTEVCLLCASYSSDQRFARGLPSDSTSRWTPLS